MVLESTVKALNVGDFIELNSTGKRRLEFLHIFVLEGTRGIVVEKNFKKYTDLYSPKLNMRYKVIFQGILEPIWMEPWTISKIE